MDVSIYSWASPIFVGDADTTAALLTGLAFQGACLTVAVGLAYARPDLPKRMGLWAYGVGCALLLLSPIFCLMAFVWMILSSLRAKRDHGRFFAVSGATALASLALWAFVPVSVQYVSLRMTAYSTALMEEKMAQRDLVSVLGMEEAAFREEDLTAVAYPAFDAGVGGSFWSITGHVAHAIWSFTHEDQPLEHAFVVRPGDRIVRMDAATDLFSGTWPVVYCFYDKDMALRGARGAIAPIDPAKDPIHLHGLCPSGDAAHALPATESPLRIFPFGDEA